jgi:hypothetical protein
MDPLGQKRIKEYSGPEAEFNDDQKRSIAILPGYEAVMKELEEVKKAIEVRRPIYCLPFSKAIDRNQRCRCMNLNSRKRNQSKGLQRTRLRKLQLRKLLQRQRFGTRLNSQHSRLRSPNTVGRPRVKPPADFSLPSSVYQFSYTTRIRLSSVPR